LLGVHSARMDIGSRDLQLDESLGLNCAWYADILLTLTEPAAP
ncbi:MAG TPA: trypsin, partial [Gammaproteobacteria bacterium]|nr:trypsin [Gammaproteobacteria bacterium]MCH77929.1 trypsin [Gammaproteobacteria bacterium]